MESVSVNVSTNFKSMLGIVHWVGAWEMYIDLLDNLLSYNIMINIIVRNAIKYDSFMQGKKTSLNSKKKKPT